MFYSEQVHKAITFAIQVHELEAHERRKGTEIPYVIHAVIVAMIVARVTDDDDTISAGAVHDTVENCKPYGSVTIATLAELFNPNVARIVSDVTEHDKSLPWLVRKMQAIEHLAHMQQDSLLVKSADVLHNMTDTIHQYKLHGEASFDKFNTSRERAIQRYMIMIPKFREVWSENPLLPELELALSNLLVLTG